MKHREEDGHAVQQLTRNQVWCLLVIVLAGLLLRFQGVARLTLCHYDEAIYVLSGAEFAATGAMHSAQPLHAPPLFPGILGVAFGFLRMTWPTLAQVFVVVCGAATIPVAFWVFQRLATNWIALLMTGLLATSDLHRVFSRMALTDVPLTLWFVLSIYSCLRLEEALHGQSSAAGAAAAPAERSASRWTGRGYLCGWILATGFFTSAAWNTKYNGWMPLVVAGTAAFIVMVRGSVKRPWLPTALPVRVALQLLLCLALAGGLAVCGFLPWAGYVEAVYPGGYRAVLAHHAGYFGGWFSWPAHAWTLLGTLAALRNAGWLCALGLITCAALPVLPRLVSKPGAGWTIGLAACATAALLGGGVDGTLLILVPFCAPLAFLRGRWPEVLIATWALAFFVATPLYQPYARLLVPMIPAAIGLVVPAIARVLSDLTGAGRYQDVANQGGDAFLVRWGGARSWGLGLVLAACFAIWQPFGFWPSPAMWERWETGGSYRRVAAVIQEHTSPNAVILCQGQPNLAVYCPREYYLLPDRDFRETLAQIDVARECFLLVDFLVVNQPDSPARRALEAVGGSLQPVAVLPNELNVVTLLNFVSPSQLVEKFGVLPQVRSKYSGLPPPITEGAADTIVLYRIRRNELETSRRR